MTIPQKVARKLDKYQERYLEWRNSDRENRCSKYYSEFLPIQDEVRFQAALNTVSQKASFGGWSLAQNALRALIGVLGEHSKINIIEFGSGSSTLFLDKYYGDQVILDSYEHQVVFAESLRSKICSSHVVLHQAELWQFDENEYQRIMNRDIDASHIFEHGTPLNQDLYGVTRARNVFYKLPKVDKQYDAMILDGPHGNGRAIAFSLLRGNITTPGYILIDDCNHYDFVYSCGKFFQFNILAGEFYPSKRWVLLEAQSKD